MKGALPDALADDTGAGEVIVANGEALGSRDGGAGGIEFAADGGFEESDGPDTVVVKVGGATAVDPANAVNDVAHLAATGTSVVVVHGGSTAVDETLADLGIEPEYVETPAGVTGRFTDAETMDAFTMAMAGSVNTGLVADLQSAGVDAVGLSGVDGGLLSGPRKSAVRVVEDGRKKIKRGDHSGTIDDVNAALLELLLQAGYVPVVTVPMLGDDDEGYTPVNADADRAAAAVAGALEATLVALTDVAGVYADPDDPETVIATVETPEAFDYLERAAEGFMTRKVMAAGEALEAGATAVVVGDANRRDPVLAALDGSGTRIEQSAVLGADDAAAGDAADDAAAGDAADDAAAGDTAAGDAADGEAAAGDAADGESTNGDAADDAAEVQQ